MIPLAVSSLAPAATLGSAVDALPGETFEALAAVPAGQLGILHDASTLLRDHRAGVVSTAEAESALVELFALAGDPALLPSGDLRAGTAVLTLFADGVLREARAQVVDGTLPPATPVLPAAVDLGARLVDALRAAATAGEGPAATCMTQFGECVHWCYTHRIGIWTTLCLADCEISLAACLRDTFEIQIRFDLGVPGRLLLP